MDNLSNNVLGKLPSWQIKKNREYAEVLLPLQTMSRSAQRGWTVWETPGDSTHLSNGVGQSQGVSGVAHLDTDRNFVSISPTSYKKSSGIRGLDSACLNNGLMFVHLSTCQH